MAKSLLISSLSSPSPKYHSKVLASGFSRRTVTSEFLQILSGIIKAALEPVQFTTLY